jgi:gamma-glutamyl hercynylcysteine S-oxide hydrolase
MCRHVVYLGPPLRLAAVLFDPPHSLLRQSYAPLDMRSGGSVNADGFGVGWYVSGREEPVRYRRDCPLWADADLPALADVTHAGAVLAAVRSATAGMPVGETAAAPFTAGPWLFSHNGVVSGWPDALFALASGLPMSDVLTLEAPTDAALLWALVRARLRGGARLVDAVASPVCDVAAAAPGSRLNLMLTDGVTAVATAFGHSLSFRVGPAGALISSEPLDGDPEWTPVPDRHLVVATAGQLDMFPIPGADSLPAPTPSPVSRHKELA